MIYTALFVVGIVFFVVLWVAVSYGVFLSREPGLAADEEGLFPDPHVPPAAEQEESLEIPQGNSESFVENEPRKSSSESSEPGVFEPEMSEPEVSEPEVFKEAKRAFDKPKPRNAMNITKKAKRPRRKN